MGNLKGKNKENKDTTENKPVKAGSTHQDDTGGIFARKVAMIIRLLKELSKKNKTNEDKE